MTRTRVAARAVLALATIALVENLSMGAALAQGKLEARYAATLAGIPIGQGAWVIDISNRRFTAAASGMTTGLVRLFASGHGSSASRGSVRKGKPVPTIYSSTLASGDRSEDLRIVMRNGTVRQVSINPPSPPRANRIPVPKSHRRGVVDPMSAGLVWVGGSGSPISARACNRTIRIFDGRMRFDLKLSFERFEMVQTGRGYSGPVVVCNVRFVPISGYVPDRKSIKYLKNRARIAAWLAPVAGTRVLVLYRLSLTTPFGLGVLQATRFVSTPTGARARVRTP